jgi:hypothetical protein
MKEDLFWQPAHPGCHRRPIWILIQNARKKQNQRHEKTFDD